MSHLHALANSLYKGLEATEATALTDRVMIIGLCSITVGETKRQLKDAIRTCYREKRKANWEKLLEEVMLSESKYGTPTMPLPFKKMSEPPLMNFNVVTAPYTGVAGVKPLVETGLDLSWDTDPWYSSLTDPMTHPVISRPMYNTPLVPQRQAAAPPNGAAMIQQPPPTPPPLPSSSVSSRSESGDDWDMPFNETIQATSPLRPGNTPKLQETAALQQQQQEAAAMQQLAAATGKVVSGFKLPPQVQGLTRNHFPLL
jgi:hypothetical protein